MLGVKVIVKETALDSNTVGWLDVGAEVEAINVESVALPRLILGSVGNPESESAIMLRQIPKLACVCCKEEHCEDQYLCITADIVNHI